MATKTAARPSSLACDICRRRHLKCDALPTCSRCQREELQCTYTASRRGHRRKDTARSSKKIGEKLLTPPISVPSPTHTPSSPAPSISTTTAPTTHDTRRWQPLASIADFSGTSQSQPTNSLMQAITAPENRSPAQSCIAEATTFDERDHLLDIYYARFHPVHPLLVPKAYYSEQRYPDYLEAVVLFVAKSVSTAPTPELHMLQQSITSLLQEEVEQSVHRIQALTMHAIILHAQHQAKDAKLCLRMAVDMGLSLGLNLPQYAHANSASPVTADSLRRTWWELWMIDVYLAALHRRPLTIGQRCLVQPLLPCTEAEYESGKCQTTLLTPLTIEQRAFREDDEPALPSYASRIEVTWVIERTLALINPTADDIQALDNAAAAWKFYLPSPGPFNGVGDIDHMLFQAQCSAHCACILLHFPRSELPAMVPTTATISGGNQYKRLASTSSHHTVQAIAASKEISNLVATPWPIDQQSPLFACALILASIVQLAAATVHLGHQNGSLRCQEQHKDRVVLLFGALTALGRRWKVAELAVKRLKPIARVIFAPPEVTDPPALQMDGDSYIDTSLGPLEGMSWLDILEVDAMI